MNWTCEQTEARLSDYLDGILGSAEKQAFDIHVDGCERCAPLVASVSHLLRNLHSMEPLETPPQLVYAILDKTLGPREARKGWRSIFGWLQGFASPRFAYSAVSVAATFIILASASGFSWRRPKLADLSPVNVYHNADRQVHLVYARSAKFVTDLRVVYEIQSRLKQDSELPATQENVVPESSPEKHPGRTDGSKPGSPRQQNRANGIERAMEVLAAELPAFCEEMSGEMLRRREP
jgi:anti-sigma factor RsiW